jgi:hypothetical protein
MCAKRCKKGKCNPEDCDKGSCKTNTVSTTAKLSMPPLSVTAAGIGVNSAVAKTEATPVAIDDPASAIRDEAAEFYKLYSQYLALRELAMPLNKLPQTDPLPAAVKITKITLEFSVDGKENTAEIPGTSLIGDVAVLIGNGLRSVIDKMYQRLFTLGHVTTSMQNAVQQAVSARATNNNTNTVSLSNKADEKAV